MEIRPLQKGDHRASLRTGDPYLDAFFQMHAGTATGHLGATYVAVALRRVLGFVTLARQTVRWESGAQRLECLQLCHLAVDRSARAQRVAEQLLRVAVQLVQVLDLDGLTTSAHNLRHPLLQQLPWIELPGQRHHLLPRKRLGTRQPRA